MPGLRKRSVLPDLLAFDGDWDRYVERVYQRFVDTLVTVPVTFRGSRVSCRYSPASKGKHFAFWHLISEGADEEERIPDLRRCERVPWVAWSIQNADTHPDLVWWLGPRGRDNNVVILNQTERFAVILGERRAYYMLLTAYPVGTRRFERLLVEYGSATGPKKS